MDAARREAIEKRWGEMEAKLEQVRLSGKSPVSGVEAEFYRQELLKELDELEYELGGDYFKRRP